MVAAVGVSDTKCRRPAGCNATDSTAIPLASTMRDSVTADADCIPML